MTDNLNKFKRHTRNLKKFLDTNNTNALNTMARIYGYSDYTHLKNSASSEAMKKTIEFNSLINRMPRHVKILQSRHTYQGCYSPNRTATALLKIFGYDEFSLPSETISCYRKSVFNSVTLENNVQVFIAKKVINNIWYKVIALPITTVDPEIATWLMRYQHNFDLNTIHDQKCAVFALPVVQSKSSGKGITLNNKNRDNDSLIVHFSQIPFLAREVDYNDYKKKLPISLIPLIDNYDFNRPSVWVLSPRLSAIKFEKLDYNCGVDIARVDIHGTSEQLNWLIDLNYEHLDEPGWRIDVVPNSEPYLWYHNLLRVRFDLHYRKIALGNGWTSSGFYRFISSFSFTHKNGYGCVMIGFDPALHKIIRSVDIKIFKKAIKERPAQLKIVYDD